MTAPVGGELVAEQHEPGFGLVDAHKGPCGLDPGIQGPGALLVSACQQLQDQLGPPAGPGLLPAFLPPLCKPQCLQVLFEGTSKRGVCLPVMLHGPDCRRQYALQLGCKACSKQESITCPGSAALDPGSDHQQHRCSCKQASSLRTCGSP